MTTQNHESTHVRVELQFVRNLGNYESLRVSIGVEDYVRKGETVDAATDRVYDFVENKRCVQDLAQSIGITSNLKTHNFVSFPFQEEYKEKCIDTKQQADVENIKTSVKETNISTTSNSSNSINVKEYYSVNSKDQLFWCLMMIVNSWDEEDLPESRDRFEYE